MVVKCFVMGFNNKFVARYSEVAANYNMRVNSYKTN